MLPVGTLAAGLEAAVGAAAGAAVGSGPAGAAIVGTTAGAAVGLGASAAVVGLAAGGAAGAQAVLSARPLDVRAQIWRNRRRVSGREPRLRDEDWDEDIIETASSASLAPHGAVRTLDAPRVPGIRSGAASGCGHRASPCGQVPTHRRLDRRYWMRGSSTSRRLSPIRLTATIVAIRRMPGNVPAHQAVARNWRPSASMPPQLGAGGCMPSPRNESDASARMTRTRVSVNSTSTEPAMFGRM